MIKYIENLTILHISDIHRTPDGEINNNVLIDSFEREIEQYRKEGIPKPNLIVVSGDIVMGVKGDKESDLLKLEEQYVEAYDFLNEMSNIFLNGDKSKLILVPGNHDISWFHSKQSMEKIDTTLLSDKIINKNDFFKHNSDTRWCWNTFEFYKVKDKEMYNNRLLSFSNFYKKFYDGDKEYSLNEGEQFEIIDFPENNVTIVGFNSCYLNDHCRVTGTINPSCLASAARKLRDVKYKERILISVWHHNTKGLPNKIDYMDSSILHKLIADEYSFVLHGHQHKTEILYEQTKINSERKLFVFSAGSLCAGSKDIPPGGSRQYNLVSLNLLDNKIDIYSRTAINIAEGDIVIWQPSGKNTLDLNIEDRNKINKLEDKYINEAIEKISYEDYVSAKELLEKLDFESYKVRKILLICYINLKSHKEIAEKYSSPLNSEEIFALINALKETKKYGKLRILLDLDIIKNSSDKSIKEYCENILKWVNYHD